MIHDLKIWPQYFESVQRGDKTLELRKNDRDYQVGDMLHLREWDPTTETHTGRECSRLVTDIVYEGEWLTPGYCAMSIADDD